MMIKLLPVLVFLMLAACKDAGISATPTAFAKTSIAPVELGNKKSSLTLSVVENIVIREQDPWSVLWRERVAGSSSVPAPTVNFDRQMVIGIFLGGYANSCYAIAVVNVEQAGEQTWVSYQVNPPEPADICAQAISYPLKLIAVPKKSGEVFFVDLSKK